MQVKSSWNSKINITQGVSFFAMLFAVFGIDLDPETQTSTVAAITAGQSIVTWVLRTWFTTEITKASQYKVR